MLTIGVHTHITNPFSSGYLCYLACIKSWTKIADEVVVVDGGSTDNSLNLLNNWLGPLQSKVKIIAPSEAHWGSGDLWEWPQIAVNRQIGFEALNTDWAIHVDADHVCHDFDAGVLRQELELHSSSILLNMPIRFYDNGHFLDRKAPRAWILNLRKIRDEKLGVAYGMDRVSGTGLDYPIHVYSNQSFRDPDTGFEKTFFWGEHVQSQGQVTLQPFSMGHFYFTPEQCIAKNHRLSVVSNRFRGVGPRTQFEIEHELRLHRKCGHEARDELLKKPFPKEVIDLMDDYYREEMLGGILYRNPGIIEERWRNSVCLVLRAKRKLWYRLCRTPCMMNSSKRWENDKLSYKLM